MKQSVHNFIEKHHLLQDGATVVVAVSGGPDSLALLHFLWKIREERNLLLIAAHVDHMFRGEISYEDYQFVEHFCEKRQIIFEGTRIDVKSYQKTKRLSSQIAARECRYRFFAEMMEKYQADYLALGHHSDDQLETMIMRQVRGSHGIGLAGIPITRSFATGKLIRPFLGITKAEIEHYCKEERLNPRTDESNFTDKYTRNRIRHNVIPQLKDENPNVHEQFQRYSEWLMEDEAFLAKLVENEMERVVHLLNPNKAELSVSRFCLVPIPLQRRMIHLILKYLYGKKYPTAIASIHIQTIVQLIHTTKSTGEVHLPNDLIVRKQYERCLFTFRSNETVNFHENLSIPGMISLPIGEITGEVIDRFLSKEKKGTTFIGDLHKVCPPFLIRPRKNGDRIYLSGLNGTKKVSRLFIDKKIPKDMRNIWPVVVDQHDTVIWVPFLAKASSAVATQATKKFLALSFVPNDDFDFIAYSQEGYLKQDER